MVITRILGALLLVLLLVTFTLTINLLFEGGQIGGCHIRIVCDDNACLEKSHVVCAWVRGIAAKTPALV